MANEMSRCKSLWIGRYNLAGQVFVERCYAFSEAQAHTLFINRIAKKVGREPWSLRGVFSGLKPNFAVILEAKFEEIEDEPLKEAEA